MMKTKAIDASPTKETSFHAFGILLITTGGISALVGILGGIFTIAAGTVLAPLKIAHLPFSEIMDGFSSINRIQGINTILFGMISVLACAAGVGLAARKTWGRRAALTWAILALSYIVAERLVNHFYIIPRIETLERSVMRLTGADPLALGVIGDVAKGGQTLSVYPYMVLALLPVATLVAVLRRHKRS